MPIGKSVAEMAKATAPAMAANIQPTFSWRRAIGLSASATSTAGITAHTKVVIAAAEAMSALTNLGYQPVQASAAVTAAMKELGEDVDTAKLIRRGLKELAR